MSVVQISRIQQRRGKKNTNTGFPQLASGELGWAIDTQELFIGNGSVSEGAPYVGNTKIITEHDQILQLVELYQYQKNNSAIQTGPTFVTPTQRSIQDKLDDIVSIRDFGALGDGQTDDTLAIQRAIDQLFLNDSTKQNTSSRVVLYVEPGEYIISNEIRIPPYAHIVGSGIDSTIIHQTADFAIFRTVDGNSTPGDYTDFSSMVSLVRPRGILVSNITLQTDFANRILYLDNTDSSMFDRVKFLGSFVNGTSPSSGQIAVEMRGASRVFRNDDVSFHHCSFSNTGYGIFSNSDHNNIGINNCVFYQLYDAINIGGGNDGAVNTKINGCYFDLIDRFGIYVKQGFGNNSTSNKFMLVGNDNNGYANASYPIIKFDTENNNSVDDYFERNSKLKDQSLFAYLPFIPNIETNNIVYDNLGFRKEVDETPGSPIVFLRFPISNSGKYMIDYVIKKTSSGNATRSGIMTIQIDVINNLTTFKDEYMYTGSNTIENIVFSALLEDYNTDAEYDTLTIKIYNPFNNGMGIMNYTYKMLTQ